jgi:hypothetical protein
VCVGEWYGVVVKLVEAGGGIAFWISWRKVDRALDYQVTVASLLLTAIEQQTREHETSRFRPSRAQDWRI